jgi:hypothetical protein
MVVSDVTWLRAPEAGGVSQLAQATSDPTAAATKNTQGPKGRAWVPSLLMRNSDGPTAKTTTERA